MNVHFLLLNEQFYSHVRHALRLSKQSFAYEVVLQYFRKFLEARIIFFLQKYLNMADLKGQGGTRGNGG